MPTWDLSFPEQFLICSFGFVLNRKWWVHCLQIEARLCARVFALSVCSGCGWVGPGWVGPCGSTSKAEFPPGRGNVSLARNLAAPRRRRFFRSTRARRAPSPLGDGCWRRLAHRGSSRRQPICTRGRESLIFEIPRRRCESVERKFAAAGTSWAPGGFLADQGPRTAVARVYLFSAKISFFLPHTLLARGLPTSGRCLGGGVASDDPSPLTLTAAPGHWAWVPSFPHSRITGATARHPCNASLGSSSSDSKKWNLQFEIQSRKYFCSLIFFCVCRPPLPQYTLHLLFM